jgi:predicted negative regulator of RcsB-dependent stress response
LASTTETKTSDSKPAKTEAKAASKAAKSGAPKKGKGEPKDAEQAANERWAILYARFQKWVSTNARTLIVTGVAIVCVAAAVTGWIVYRNWVAETASNIVFRGASADVARVGNTVPADVKQHFGIFSNESDRVNAEKTALDSVRARYGGTPYALVARLSQANIALDANKFDEAASIFGEIIGDPQSKAFAFLRVRAIEGMGITRENQKRYDDAITYYQSLASEPFHGAKQLGLYRLSHVYQAKGDTVTAVAKLKEAKELFDKAPVRSADVDLENHVVSELQMLDPTTAAPTSPSTLSPDMDPAALQEMINQMQQQQQPAPSAPH